MLLSYQSHGVVRNHNYAHFVVGRRRVASTNRKCPRPNQHRPTLGDGCSCLPKSNQHTNYSDTYVLNDLVHEPCQRPKKTSSLCMRFIEIRNVVGRCCAWSYDRNAPTYYMIAKQREYHNNIRDNIVVICVSMYVHTTLIRTSFAFIRARTIESVSSPETEFCVVCRCVECVECAT